MTSTTLPKAPSLLRGAIRVVLVEGGSPFDGDSDRIIAAFRTERSANAALRRLSAAVERLPEEPRQDETISDEAHAEAEQAWLAECALRMASLDPVWEPGTVYSTRVVAVREAIP